MLEVGDRLFSAFGQDTIDALFWTATEPRDRKREHLGVIPHMLFAASATSATADGLAPEGASQTKKFCLQVIKKRHRKKFCLQVIKKRPRKPDVADVHEWCSAATG
ncbi:Protein TAPT1 homolog [Eumeta japonica]|uniref:Protein TAPT1 homolog n=1 Tax=Eumeta variegata TaxID=151549 RepID=A0A4C1Y8B1_EUMVA|nr:Protein TAPT1 homolog [Eumeta japonica]